MIGRGSYGRPWILRQVMDDETAPLALRVDAAKALLPYGGLGAPTRPKPAPP